MQNQFKKIYHHVIKNFFLSLVIFFCTNATFSQDNLTYKGKVKPKKEKLEKENLQFEIQNLGPATWEKQINNNSIEQKSSDINVSISTSKSVYTHTTKEIKPETIQLGIPTITKRLPFKIPDSRTISFKYLNTLCGLPSDNVISLCDDEFGNIWVASDVGIYKISGFYIHFYDYKQNFPECSPEKIISYKSKIYIATFGQGLFVLEGSKVEMYKLENGFYSNHIIGFDKDSSGLFINYYGNGIIFHKENNTFSQITFSDKNTNDVVVETKNSPIGRIFITEKGIIGILHESQKQFKTISSPDFFVDIKSKIASNYEQLYISTYDKGLLYYYKDKFKLITGSNINKIDQLFFAKSGSIWAFGQNGLSNIRKDKIVGSYSQESYFSKFQASSFFQDKSSNLWISSYNKGIGIISPSNFSQINIPNEFNTPIKAIYVDKNKNKYVESKHGGLLKIDSNETLFSLSNTSIHSITSIVLFKDKLYISSLNGLYYIENNQLFKLFVPSDNGLNTHLFLTSTQDGLYINNYNYGVLYFDGKQLSRLLNFSTLTYCSHADKDNNIWIANDTRGLSKIKNDSVTHYTNENGFVSNRIYSISSDEFNNVYIGSPKGLAVLKNDSLFRIPIPFQSSEKIINCSYNTFSKSLWISNGVEIFNVQLLNNKTLLTKYNRNEIIANGVIQSNTLICDEKNMLFGVGDQLVNYIDFKFGYQDEEIPIELIEIKTRNTTNESEFRIEDLNNFTFNNEKLILEAGNYDLNISVDIKHWGKEEGMLFYYKVIGWSENWKGPITDNTIAFSNLPPGNYTLEIKGESTDNVKIKPFVFKFQIEHFFYQTTWFLLLCTGIVLLLIYLLFKTYSSFDFRSFESYTSLNEVLVKIRLLSVFSIILFPAIEFYECVYLDLYPIEWISIFIIVIFSIISFALSFNKRLVYRSGYTLLIFAYLSFYFIYVFKGFRLEFPPSLSVEVAIIILFSKLIFSELRSFFYFILYSIVLNVFCFLIVDLEGISSVNLNIYISASINAGIIVFVMYLVDYNSKRNVLFANKILESTDLFVLVCDEKGKIIFINEYLRKVTNKSDNELLGFGWWKYRNYNDHKLSDTIVKINSMIKLGQSDAYVNTLILEDQSLFIEWNDFVLDHKYLIGIGKDVTKEYTLNQQNERLSLVAKSVTNGVVITDNKGLVQWVNQSFEQLFDIELQHIEGQNITELYRKGTIDNETFQGDLKSNSSFEFHFSSEKTISRWLLINTTPIFGSNKEIVNYISVVTNISTRKKLETKLAEYADDLEINNLLKEQLIYSNNFEDISSVSLSTIIQKIPSIKVGSLILLNNSKTGFTTYYFDNDKVTKVNYSLEDIKGFEVLKHNKIYCEKDIRILSQNELSFSDKKRHAEDGIISFIELPIIYDNEFIGALGLEFDCVFPLSDKQVELLKNFTVLLSVAIYKIQIQQDLTLKNKDITDSLYYAKSIQTSYLPQKEDLQNVLKNFVLYYKPKDIVSGDFYWLEDLPNHSIIALGDCTGHGVPGAFITMLGHNLLTQITSELSHYSPSKMLEYINEKIYLALNKNKETYIKDGMELGICVFDKNNKTMLFAGSGIELHYFQNNELKTIDVPRYMIGDNLTQNTMEDILINLDGSEKFYLSSDGYPDQLGGEPRKRYTKMRYVKLLTEIKNLPSFQQSFILNLNHQNHKGNHEQTDDILVIGFELQ